MLTIRNTRTLATSVAICLLAACAGSPKRPPELVRLDNELSRLRSNPVVAGNAGAELAEADRAIQFIASDGRRMRAELFDHNIYIAGRLLQIAEAEGRAVEAKKNMDQLSVEREQLIAQARAAEADQARLAATRAQQSALASQREAENAKARADAERMQANAARIDADLAREDAAQARSELTAMRQMLVDLEAKQTERGLLVTLGDVLFETDRAELKPGAQRNLDKLAAALGEYPNTTVAIEGHTDSTGDNAYNLNLSAQRARSVEVYLTSRGIAQTRLAVRGLGEDYPVASNDNAAGKQQNRRVEVIIQDANVAR